VETLYKREKFLVVVNNLWKIAVQMSYSVENKNFYRGGIFRPQTRRVCEIAVLLT
jgi:hypothetical protein